LFSKLRLSVALLGGVLALCLARPALAVPVFAERYGLSCSACHTAVPELNAFGNAFRRNGFVLPGVARHKEIPIALRFQETYIKDLPQSATRRFNALAILIGTFNFGPQASYSFFGRYFFGTQGGPGSLYYAFMQHVNAPSGVFERAGLFNLPLIANATQRLDTITPQPVYTYEVGHSSANFTDPRWGVEFGQRTSSVDVEFALSGDEYHGAAYGAPTPPSGLQQSYGHPEFFGTATFGFGDGFRLGALVLDGTRNFSFSSGGGAPYSDNYNREGVQGGWTSASGRVSLVGQQVWGYDTNTDGFGTAQVSSGGFALFKYYPTPHAYIGVRYDAVANPSASRDWDFYGAVALTHQSRVVIEQLVPINSPGTTQQTNAQLLFALPDPHWVK
jgi:hypothetical protein